MPHGPPGKRPRRVDREQLKHDVILGLTAGLPLSVVARRNGTCQRTVSSWEHADPAFADEITQRHVRWDGIALAAQCLEDHR